MSSVLTIVLGQLMLLARGKCDSDSSLRVPCGDVPFGTLNTLSLNMFISTFIFDCGNLITLLCGTMATLFPFVAPFCADEAS